MSADYVPPGETRDEYVAPWRRDPANFKHVRVNRHYWIDAGLNYQLAHLVPLPMPKGQHEANAVCEVEVPLWEPLIGEGVVSVPLHRACPRCIDLMKKSDVIS